MASSVQVISKTGDYYVVNTSPSLSQTEYTIVEGTEAQAESIKNAGGISGPYRTESAAYNVWKSEPGNKSVSTLQEIEAAIGAGVANIANPDNPTADVNAAATAQTVLGLPTLSHLRDLMIRVMKVAVGAALVIIGVAQLTGAEKLMASVPKIVPV
jgi:hypothetical protein